MALVSRKPGASISAKPATAAATSSSHSAGDKMKQRTLARQQQISETIANTSMDLLTRTQEAVSAVEQLKSAMEQISAAAEQNAGAAEESLSAVNQIQKNTDIILRDSKVTATSVKAAQDSVGQAITNIEKSASRITEAANVADEVAKKSDDLKEASENIGNSVVLIADVADQTNLLALNAAIEAARAKEHGKGFAVVADETRALAEINAKNADATREVVNKIQSSIEKVGINILEAKDIIQNAADNANKIADQGADVLALAENGVNNTTSAEEKLEILLEEVNIMQSSSQAIATAAEEQSSAVNEASASIEAQAGALAESEQAASQLSDLAEALKTSTDASKDAAEIAAIAEELTQAIGSINQSIDEIVGALNQIETASELAEKDARKNSETAATCANLVAESKDLLVNANKNVNQLKDDLMANIDSLNNIIDLVNHSIDKGSFTTNEMLEVEQNAMSINKTLRKIENIVGQTTTLAVSGNIEAARAGEFGKGFAVVSSDIRNLAIDAGANIDKIIDTMNILDSEVANIIRDWGIAVAEQEAEKSQLLNVTDELKIVAKDTEKVITLLDSLSAYADENLTALEQTRTGSEQITTAAGQTMSNSAESKSAAELIQSTVGRMSELVEELAVAADELQRG